MAMFKHLFFDLDGTLLETIEDITIAINEALEKNGLFHEYSTADVTRFIGDGADMLVRRAMKEKADDKELFAAVKKEYMPLYKKYQNDHAHPFDGLVDALKDLKSSGKKLYVVTNKPHALADFIVKDHFGDLFLRIEGHQEGAPVKPDPYLVNKVIEEEGIKKEECLYVGDSKVDIETAKNAGMPCCLVTWGYGIYDEKTVQKADYCIKNPVNLRDFI